MQIKFPDVITSNLIENLDFSLEKCEEIITNLEKSELDIFGSGSIRDKESKRNSYIIRAINNLVISHLVNQGFPLIQEEAFNLKRWFKVAFPKDEDAYVLEDSMVEPDWTKVKKQEDGVQVRWGSGNYLVSVSAESKGSKSAEIGSLRYVGRRNTDLKLKANLPCGLPLEIEALQNKFMSELHLVAHKGYSSSTIAKYLTTARYSYYSETSIISEVKPLIYWAPKLEDIYTFEQIIPPPGDPVLVVEWKNQKFFIGNWDTNRDEDNLNTIISEFVV